MNAYEDRFWEKVDRLGPTPVVCPGLGRCWLWTATRDEFGYGGFRLPRTAVRGRWERAHRVSWELAHGPIPEGLHVLHRCDVPACVNPAHLFIGTLADNNRDRQEKGRTVLPDNRGEKHGRAKLTASDVERIRSIYAAGGTSQRALAQQFGISQTEVNGIVRGLRWALPFNPYEDIARTRKAVVLVDLLDAFGISPDRAEELTAGQRLDVATAAGVRMPSNETWAMTVDLLRHRLSIRASVTDPFAELR